MQIDLPEVVAEVSGVAAWVRFPEGRRIVAAHVSFAASIDPHPNQWGNP